MDGNRRYAKSRNQDIIEGHVQGGEKLMEMIALCEELGINTVTAFAFSIDNFKRSKEEVDSIMKVAVEKLTANLPSLIKRTRVRVFGNLTMLPKDLQFLLATAVNDSKHITKANLNICFAYTSTDEITRATRMIVEGVKSGMINVEDIDDKLFEYCLDSFGQPDPDIIIRTSGEIRLSDFLLWQGSGSHLQFLHSLWPQYNWYDMFISVLNYQRSCYLYPQNREELITKTKSAPTDQTSSKVKSSQKHKLDLSSKRERTETFIKFRNDTYNKYILSFVQQQEQEV